MVTLDGLKKNKMLGLLIGMRNLRKNAKEETDTLKKITGREISADTGLKCVLRQDQIMILNKENVLIKEIKKTEPGKIR